MEVMLRILEEEKLTNRQATNKFRTWVETNPLFQDSINVGEDIESNEIAYNKNKIMKT
jgi:hypothetical protein